MGALLLLSTVSFGQISINCDNQTQDISGQTYNMVAPNHQAFDVSLHVNNETGSTKQWRVTRYRVSVPEGWSDFLCWGHSTDPFGGICFSSNQMNGNPWTSPASQAVQFDVNDGEYAKLKATIDADDWYSGTAHYKYYIVEGNVKVDSVDLMIQFTADVDENHTYTNCQVYPNPATSVINLKCDEEIENICVYNLVGDKIDEQTFGNSVVVSEFLTGFYIVVLKTKNNKICRRVFLKK